MKATEIHLGGVYIAKVSGVLTRVRIDRLAPEYYRGGWSATNLATGRKIHIATAARLRREVTS